MLPTFYNNKYVIDFNYYIANEVVQNKNCKLQIIIQVDILICNKLNKMFRYMFMIIINTN